MAKPSLSIADQITRLKHRGLQDSRNDLTRALMTHGYFRLSGYWRYFQNDPSGGHNAFTLGTDFAGVFDVYQRDAEMRNLLLEGLSEVEVAFRASLVANLCVPGQDGTEYQLVDTYTDRTDDSGASLRDRLLDDIKNDVDRSKERHVRHHRKAGVAAVPLWVATEALSFGILSRMYGLLADESTQKKIAKRFGYDGGLFTSMGPNMRAVAVFRNVCAHHSRIWNRTIDHDKPRLFAGAFGPGETPRSFSTAPWGIICTLGHMVKNVRGNDSFMDDVRAAANGDPAYVNGLKSPNRM